MCVLKCRSFLILRMRRETREHTRDNGGDDLFHMQLNREDSSDPSRGVRNHGCQAAFVEHKSAQEFCPAMQD